MQQQQQQPFIFLMMWEMGVSQSVRCASLLLVSFTYIFQARKAFFLSFVTLGIRKKKICPLFFSDEREENFCRAPLLFSPHFQAPPSPHEIPRNFREKKRDGNDDWDGGARASKSGQIAPSFPPFHPSMPEEDRRQGKVKIALVGRFPCRSPTKQVEVIDFF